MQKTKKVRLEDVDLDEILRKSEEILGDLEPYAQQCHATSLKLVKAGVGKRVARGRVKGMLTQHSWVVLGDNPYDLLTPIVDPTLWSYKPNVWGIFVGLPECYGHTPHGYGSIWEWGKPVSGGGTIIKLTPKIPLSESAEYFLGMIGELDFKGWHMLASQAPVEGWDAGEILKAITETEELKALVPIDRIGMLTDLNPSGLYF